MNSKINKFLLDKTIEKFNKIMISYEPNHCNYTYDDIIDEITESNEFIDFAKSQNLSKNELVDIVHNNEETQDERFRIKLLKSLLYFF